MSSNEILGTFDKPFTIDRLIGSGGYSNVYEVTRRVDGAKLALKLFKNGRSSYLKHWAHEAKLLEKLSSTSVVGLQKVTEEALPRHIFMDLCHGGDLFERVISRGKYTEKDGMRFMHKFVEGMQKIHSHNVCHLDLKPENILFSHKDEASPVVLADFNLAREMGSDGYVTPGMATRGTLGYTAPEVLLKQRVGCAADVFSAGVVLYIVLTGGYPFTAFTDKETWENTFKGAVVYDRVEFKNLSANARHLITRMLNVDQDLRITWEGVLTHPWMQHEAPTVVDVVTVPTHVSPQEEEAPVEAPCCAPVAPNKGSAIATVNNGSAIATASCSTVSSVSVVSVVVSPDGDQQMVGWSGVVNQGGERSAVPAVCSGSYSPLSPGCSNESEERENGEVEEMEVDVDVNDVELEMRGGEQEEEGSCLLLSLATTSSDCADEDDNRL